MGEKTETVTDFIFLGSKITADSGCGYEIKRCLLFERKSYGKPRQYIKKQRHYFANKVIVCIVKAMVFPVVMYRCESWIIKKAEHQRTDAFKLWCWSRLLKFLWIARTSNQSILKKINSEYSLGGLLLKLIWLANAKSWLIGKDHDAGKYGKQKEKGAA